MGVDLFAMPKNYRTAVMLIKKRRKLEAYRDDLIPSYGVDTIRVIYPKSILELGESAEYYNKLKPDFIAFASLTITGFVRESSSYNSYNAAIKTARTHFAKALKSVGIYIKDVRVDAGVNSKDIEIVQIGV